MRLHEGFSGFYHLLHVFIIFLQSSSQRFTVPDMDRTPEDAPGLPEFHHAGFGHTLVSETNVMSWRT
jgi:hypothetical protein